MENESKDEGLTKKEQFRLKAMQCFLNDHTILNIEGINNNEIELIKWVADRFLED